MAYEKQSWLARTGVKLNRFKDLLSGKYFELQAEPETIEQEGTAFTAERMNHMEDGILQAATTADNAQPSYDVSLPTASKTIKGAITEVLSTSVAAMPKAGGTFTGDVIAVNYNRTGVVLRNIYVNGANTNYILMVRK